MQQQGSLDAADVTSRWTDGADGFNERCISLLKARCAIEPAKGKDFPESGGLNSRQVQMLATT
ncbi:hypothetical protein BN2476_270042 [Paraburkholderia piptadeniae]|uniref:Uncharacterized protein n=1 Tax=Paraburkholderia piptadeniae TaxID=1701573 RepID=A0A1N7S1G4_9BURK|nr:hypothetical protein BN2476_270042 [Paraburkholderia piptadeniae]